LDLGSKEKQVIVLVMQVHVKPSRRDEFLSLIDDVATCSERDEPGCLRFDVLQDDIDPDKFIFYDVYSDEVAKAAHRETAHYARWVEGTRDMFDQPTIASWTHNVVPNDKGWR
jgi:quinol monooxygenase YgiN